MLLVSFCRCAGRKGRRRPLLSLRLRRSSHPELAQLVDTVSTGNGWLHEMKYDGYRTLIAIGGGDARTYG